MPEQVCKAMCDNGVCQHRATQSFWSIFYKKIQNSALKTNSLPFLAVLTKLFTPVCCCQVAITFTSELKSISRTTKHDQANIFSSM